jgi:hypothetical protein
MNRRWQIVVVSCMITACIVNADLGGGADLGAGSSKPTLNGGIRSTAPIPAGAVGIRLVAGGFELGPRRCDTARMCVTGGIVP